jgi:hypothetical protein
MKSHDLGPKIIIAIIVGVIVFVLDTSFARWVYHDYEPIAKGILGISILVTMYRYLFPKGLTNSFGFSFTNNIEVLKFFLFIIYMMLVGYWALREFIDMIFYLVKLFTSK